MYDHLCYGFRVLLCEILMFLAESINSRKYSSIARYVISILEEIERSERVFEARRLSTQRIPIPPPRGVAGANISPISRSGIVDLLTSFCGTTASPSISSGYHNTFSWLTLSIASTHLVDFQIDVPVTNHPSHLLGFTFDVFRKPQLSDSVGGCLLQSTIRQSFQLLD